MAEAGLYDKIKDYIFPAKKVLDKAAAQGGDEGKVTPAEDTSYLSNIVKQREIERKKTLNPLAKEIGKSTQAKVPK